MHINKLQDELRDKFSTYERLCDELKFGPSLVSKDIVSSLIDAPHLSFSKRVTLSCDEDDKDTKLHSVSIYFGDKKDPLDSKLYDNNPYEHISKLLIRQLTKFIEYYDKANIVLSRLTTLELDYISFQKEKSVDISNGNVLKNKKFASLTSLLRDESSYSEGEMDDLLDMFSSSYDTSTTNLRLMEKFKKAAWSVRSHRSVSPKHPSIVAAAKPLKFSPPVNSFSSDSSSIYSPTRALNFNKIVDLSQNEQYFPPSLH